MAAITTLATLKTALLDFYNRADLTTSSGGQLEVLIAQAEQRFQRDERIREPGSNNVVLPSLMVTDPNWLLTAEQDIYVYGTLVEMAVFLRDWEQIPTFEARYQDACEKLSGSVRLNPARTLAITSYAELQTLVADALNRGDMKNVIPVCIALAESKLRNDQRIKSLTSVTYSITGDDLAVPSGFRQLDTWYYDGTAYYGDIEIVDAGTLSVMKARYGTAGPPRYAAILGNGATFRFAPAPTTTYSTKMTYWSSLTALASGANWLYTNHPHIYFLATLAQCGPWVRGDVKASQTVLEAAGQLDGACEDLLWEQTNRQFAGKIRNQFDPIG